MTDQDNGIPFEKSNHIIPVKINDEILTILYGLAERDKNILPDIQNLEKESQNFSLWISLGRKLIESKNLESALECFDNAIQLRSDLPDGWYYKGQTLANSGKYEKAIGVL